MLERIDALPEAERLPADDHRDRNRGRRQRRPDVRWPAKTPCCQEAAARRPALRIVIDGVLVNILNPKLSIFFVAFLPQFISPVDPSPLSSMMELSGVFMAMTFVVFAVYGVFAAVMRERVVSRPSVMAWMRRTFAAAFVMLGARLALTER